MKLAIEPGIYVVAVSGGVDSMVLLDVLRKQDDAKLVVAHFDHGIRLDSKLDRILVQKAAEKYGLPFVYNEGNLGPKVSEETARKARYEFLHRVRMASGARAIITAHHEDDMLETAILNMLRGTGRRGLSSLKSHDILLRPLLHINKRCIHEYAKEHKILWREDSTNTEERYVRNYVRKHVLGKFTETQKKQLLGHIDQARILNQEIDHLVTSHLHVQPATHLLDRRWFINLPHSVAREIMAGWLRARGVLQFDAKAIERLVASAKTYQANKQADVNSKYVIEITKDHLALKTRNC